MIDSQKNREFVKNQIARLAGKDFAPTGPALTEVVNTLVACAESGDHARLVVEELLREPGKFPEPAIFREVSARTRNLEFQPDPDCSVCCGGWLSVPHKYQFGSQMVETTKSARCGCWAWRPKGLRPWEAVFEPMGGRK